MSILGFEVDEIAQYIRMLQESGMDELVIKEEGRYLRLRGPAHAVSAVTPVYVAAPSVAPAPVRQALPPATQVQAAEEEGIILTSPMMGTFFRAEKPGAPPMVSVGQHVSVGQPIGIIEAMKIFSEVLAEHAGVVSAVPAKDGQLVQAGEPLVVLRKE